MEFVNLSTLFLDTSQRELRFLEGQYNNLFLIKAKICEICHSLVNNSAIIRNKNVLLKPNWVRHKKRPSDSFSLITHENIIIVLLEIILEHKPRKVVIGDAPIQSCDWNKMIGIDFIRQIKAFSRKYDVPIILKDFRRAIWNEGKGKVVKNRRSLDEYIIFDLNGKSYLEPVSKGKTIFRVTNYDPMSLARSHGPGIHRYCITKEFFNADVVISMPKVKTHQKTGISCALKNLVGVNGDKDFLPHHRVGGTGFGGDCYPGKNYFRRISEVLLDNANMNIGKLKYYFWLYLTMFFWKVSRPTPKHQLEAGWYGNDTTWRMVLDLNIISIYGKPDGSIADIPQREIYSLCDGIIGGQGNGPLKPAPLPLGVMSFSNNAALNDMAMAVLMKFDIEKIPLIKTGAKDLVHAVPSVCFNGSRLSVDELRKYALKTVPPPGWVGQIEYSVG